MGNSKINKLISNPKKYIPMVPRVIIRILNPLNKEGRKLLGQAISHLFLNTSFYLQGRMDIEPKSLWYNDEFNNQTGGFCIPGDNVKREIVDLYTWDQTRRDMLILLLRSILEREIQGDLIEIGVYKGISAKMIHYYMPDRRLYLFDTFDILDERDLDREKRETGIEYDKGWFVDASIENVLKYIDRKNDNITIIQGYFPNTIPEEFDSKTFAFVHIDISLYKPTIDALNYFYEKTSSGGIIVLHDYNSNPSVRKSTDEFMKNKIEIPIPMPDKSGSVLIVKQ